MSHIKKIIQAVRNESVSFEKSKIDIKEVLEDETEGMNYKIIDNKYIYNISLCSNIYNNRRRLLYKDCYDMFDLNKTIYDGINIFMNLNEMIDILLREKKDACYYIDIKYGLLLMPPVI